MQELMSFAQQHWPLSLGLITVFIALVILELIRSKKSNWELTASQVTRMINHENAVVVDIRNQEAFAKGHIINSVSAVAHELKEPAKKFDKYKSKPLIFVCTSGLESRKIAALLKADGYQAYVLSGGIRTWIAADMPLVKG